MALPVNPYRVVIGTTNGTAADGGVLASVQTIANAALPASQVGAASGAASLDATGRVPVSQLPASITGAVVYQGTWNASTNTPTLTSGTGTKGQYYKVSVAGSTTLDGLNQWNVGDTAIFDGTTWDKIDGVPNEVISVAGRTGAVTLTQADVPGTIASTSINQPGGVAGLDGFGYVKTGAAYAPTLKAVSTSTSAIRLTTDGNTAGAANSLPMSVSTLMRIEGQVMARNTSTNDSIHWDVSFAIRRNTTGSPVLSAAGPSITTFDTDPAMSGCALSVTIDSTNNCFALNGTGLASVTIDWTANLQVTYAT